jgi:hypothetical protein
MTQSRHSYDFWHRACKGEKQPVHEGEPHPGRWYMRDRHSDGGVVVEGPRLPVAIWEEGGQLLALVGFDGRASFRDPSDIWSYVCQHPVHEADYLAAFESGQWPDDPPEPMTPPIDADPPKNKFASAKNMLAGEIETGALYLATSVETKEQADKVSVLATRVGKLAKRAEDIRKAEKQPHLDAGRAVDAKWAEIIDGARDLVARLKKHVEPFLLAQRKAEEERRRAEHERADELRRQAATANDPDTREELTRQAHDADREAAPRNPSAGRTGAKVALRTVYVAVITDYDACYAALKEHNDMRSFVQQLADRACRAKVPLAGVEFRAEEKAA